MPRVAQFLSGLIIPIVSYIGYLRFKHPGIESGAAISKNFDIVDWWTDSRFLASRDKLQYFLRHVPKSDESNSSVSLLDVGCGGGILAESLAELGYQVTGIDTSLAAIETAKNHAQTAPETSNIRTIQYLHGSVYSLPFPDASFNVVLASSVMEHLTNVSLAASEIFRVLKPGGTFLFDSIDRSIYSRAVIVGLAQELLNIIPRGTHDWSLFQRPAELRHLLASAGFLTDEEMWVGRQWNLSLAKAVKTGNPMQGCHAFHMQQLDEWSDESWSEGEEGMMGFGDLGGEDFFGEENMFGQDDFDDEDEEEEEMVDMGEIAELARRKLVFSLTCALGSPSPQMLMLEADLWMNAGDFKSAFVSAVAADQLASGTTSSLPSLARLAVETICLYQLGARRAATELADLIEGKIFSATASSAVSPNLKKRFLNTVEVLRFMPQVLQMLSQQSDRGRARAHPRRRR